MNTVWTLTYTPPAGAPQTKTLADWGIDAPFLQFANQAPDTFSFSCPDERLLDEPQFAYNGTVALIHETMGRVFFGYVKDTGSYGSDAQWGRQYSCVGPWWKFEETAWVKGVQMLNQAGTLISSFQSTNFIMNNSLIAPTIKEELVNAVTWATQAGIAVTLDSNALLPNSAEGQIEYIAPKSFEVRDLTIAEGIRTLLRWLPSAVTWFDYTTNDALGNPAPTLHCRTRPSMTAVSLTTGEATGAVVESWQIKPRPDLVRSKVMLRFQRRGTFEGREVMQILDDVYPAGAFAVEPHALVNTIDQKGPDVAQSYAEVTLRKVPWNGTQQQMVDFWKEVYGEKLNDARVSNLVIDGTSWKVQGPNDADLRAPTAADYVGEIVDGQVPGWMRDDGGAVVDTTQLTWVVNATWEFTDDAQNVGGVKVTQKMAMQLEHNSSFCSIAVPGTSRVYTARTTDVGESDPIITGLAQALYNQLSVLQYEGEITVHSRESEFPARMGNSLNLLGERPEFGTMAAQIQAMSCDLAAGNTTFQIGPAQALGPQDMIELLI